MSDIFKDDKVAESVLPIEVRAGIVAAFYKIDYRVRPMSLPIGAACAWLAGCPENEWKARIILLESVCVSEGINPIGDTWRKKVDDLMALAHNAEAKSSDPSPAMTPEQISADVAKRNPPKAPPVPDADEDAGGEPSEGLDSFTSGAPTSDLEPPKPAKPPEPKAQKTKPKK